MAPLTILFTLDILLGMLALRAVNVPMFTVLRRLTVLVVRACRAGPPSSRTCDL
jgi:hypothetical protein